LPEAVWGNCETLTFLPQEFHWDAAVNPMQILCLRPMEGMLFGDEYAKPITEKIKSAHF
jgi:hypothetical protein